MKNLILITTTIILLSGCNSQTNNGPEAEESNNRPTGAQYIAQSEPPSAMPVGEARQSVTDGETVTLIGHIGGSTNPFVDGLAAFTIVDPKVQYCLPEEGCPTPWDYCCTQNEVKDNIATVKFVDEQQKPVPEDARKLLGVEELSLVVVTGQAQRDEQGNLSVLAKKVFVRSSN